MPPDHRLALRLALALALAINGCAPGAPPVAPTAPDAIPESTVTGGAMLEGWARDGEHVVSPPLEAHDGATRIGLLVVLHGPGPMPHIEVRGVDETGRAGAWSRLETTFEESDQAVQRLDLPFVARRAELRMDAVDAARVATLTWSALVPPPALDAAAPPEVGLAREALRAELRTLGVRDRASWGARATRCTGPDPVKTRMAIHHTVTPSSGDPAARLRGIQAYHMDTNGWCDIGYHFLVSLDGTLWEGRELELLGTHVGGHNTGNIGISFIGCFQTSGCSTWTPFTPPDAMIEPAGRLVGELARIHGIAVSSSTVLGHRDHPDQGTECPGDNLHALLDRIRSIATTSATPRFGAQWVSQTFPLASDPFALAGGTIVPGAIEMRNVGAETWTPGATFLGTTQPRDVASPLAAPDWVSPRRAATVDRTVPPGEVGRFVFSVRAPDTVGDYPQFFSLVQEGVAWFSDPGMGGPADDQLQVRVTVTSEASPDAGATPDGGTVAADAGTPIEADAAVSTRADAAVGPDGSRDLGGTCGCAAAGAGGERGAGAVSVLALALALARRRRQSAARTS